jgi:RNA polymerase sigma factor (sigma-70 family)
LSGFSAGGHYKVSMTDFELLQRYGRQRSEEAFATLVSRYSDLVYSIATRQVQSRHLAEEITQAVFLTLAQKARSLPEQTILSGWLFRTTRFVANNAVKREARRAKREELASITMHNEPESASEQWQEVAPELDNCLADLSEEDRCAVLLRFFEHKSLAEVGAALAISEEAARKRIGRALDQLRNFLGKKGIVLPVGVLSALLYSHAIEAAPVSLAPLIAASLAKVGAASLGTLGALKGIIATMAWTKTQTAILGTALIGLVVTVVNVAFKSSHSREDQLLRQSGLAESSNRSAITLQSQIPTKHRLPADEQVELELHRLREENAALKRKLAETYGRLIIELADTRTSREDRIQLLIQAMEDEYPEIRRSAAFALMENGKYAAAAAPALIKALKDPDPDVRILAIRALGEIGPAGKEAVPLLEQAVADPGTAFDAALALWSVSHDPEIPIKVLLPAALPDKGGHAIRALGEMGPAAQAAIPTLQEAMKSDDNNRKYDSIEALWRIDKSLTPQLIGPLVDMLSNPQTHPVHLRYAANLLGQMGAEASASVPALTGLLSYSDEKVKGAAVTALQEIAQAGSVETGR